MLCKIARKKKKGERPQTHDEVNFDNGKIPQCTNRTKRMQEMNEGNHLGMILGNAKLCEKHGYKAWERNTRVRTKN